MRRGVVARALRGPLLEGADSESRSATQTRCVWADSSSQLAADPSSSDRRREPGQVLRSLKHILSVERQILRLRVVEASNWRSLPNRPSLLHGWSKGGGRFHRSAFVKGNEPLVEQRVHVWRQEETVVAVDFLRRS